MKLTFIPATLSRQDSTTGLKIPFSKGNLRIVELQDPCPLVRPLAVPDNVHSS